MRQTRTNRKNNAAPQPPKDPKNKNPEYIYYAIIGLLLIILVGIAVFIFSNWDSATDSPEDNGTFDSEEMTESDNGEDGMVIEENDEDQDAEESEDNDEETEDDTEENDEPEETEVEEDNDEDVETETDTEDDTDADADEEEDTDEPEEDEAEVSVNDNAPLDESYVPNYGEGSADRNAIASLVSSVTGLDQNSMITWRVGNNGPGRVFAIMSDSSQNDVYRTFLQYGDGEWHVTAYEQIPEVPAEFR